MSPLALDLQPSLGTPQSVENVSLPERRAGRPSAESIGSHMNAVFPGRVQVARAVVHRGRRPRASLFDQCRSVTLTALH